MNTEKIKATLDLIVKGGLERREMGLDPLDVAECLALEVQRLNHLINNPHIHNWYSASVLEAAHQQERWGTQDDAGKTPMDWFWLVGYLAGKAVAHLLAGNTEKGLHHIISTSAALLNWHRNVTGVNTAMRPGIGRKE